MKSKQTLFLLLFMLPLWGSAQDVAVGTLTWHAQEVTDLQTSVSKQMTCHFVTRSNNSVEWIQKDGALKTLFTITSVEGQWPDVSSQGTISYDLERNGKTVKMILEKTASGILVTMDFSKPGEYVSKLQFKITSVE